MKITCKISGVELARYQHFAGLHVVDVHPIFEMPARVIWRMVPSFNTEKITGIEKKLLFLALANTTGLLQFRVPAIPSAKIVVQNFPVLADMAGWIHQLQAPGVRFPQYIVRKGTEDMANIKLWLEALMAVREEFYDGKAKQEHKQRMLRLQAKIELGVKYEALGQDGAISKAVAEWALDAAEVPVATRDAWFKLLITPRERMYNKSESEIIALIEHFELYLPHGSIAAHVAMKRARELLEHKADSMGFYEILDGDYDPDGHPSYNKEVSQTPMAQAAFMDAPTEEPVRGAYASAVAYSIARARWVLAQSIRQQPPSSSTGSEGI